MVIVRAPVRASFGGGGTDLAAYYERFGGLVVSTSITRSCYVLASPAPDGAIRIASADYGVQVEWPFGTPPPADPPLALPKAAVALFMERGLLQQGVSLSLASDVPPGSGLGASSAMAVALAKALSEFCGVPAMPGDVAELACALEIERLGMPIGKQDQYASAFGGLNALEFERSGVRVTPLNVAPDTRESLDSRLLLFWTGKSRDSSGILHHQRADTETKPEVVESLHRLKALAGEMRTALEVGALDAFGRLLDRAWREKSQLSGRVSTAAINDIYAAACRAGALGGKITGAGGGGFLLLYCPLERQHAVRTVLARYRMREFPFALDTSGVQLLSAMPAGLAQRMAFAAAGAASDVAGSGSRHRLQTTLGM